MLKQRAEVGLSKYGTDTTRQDLSLLQWLRHAQEEAMDLAVYLQRIITDLESQPPEQPDNAFLDQEGQWFRR